MALHPQAQARVDAANALGLPPTETLPVEAVRAGYDNIVRTPGPEVGSVTDVDADGVGVRVYQPLDGAPSPAPLVVFMHGGGWTIGSLTSHDPICRHLCAEAEAVVVAVDYRLAPEHPYPAAPDDCWTALQWALASAAELGADPSRVAVVGDSAGGNLATVTAIRARDAGGPKIAAQVLVYPIVDGAMDSNSFRDNGEGYILTRGITHWFWTNYAGLGNHRLRPECSPLRNPDLTRLPPTLVITAGYDPLRDEGQSYASHLRNSGVDVRLLDLPGMIHTFFEDIGAYDDARLAMDEVVSFLRTHLASGD